MVAHNVRTLDGWFILQYVAENDINPVPILSGQKIMAFEVKALKIRFIDSQFLTYANLIFQKIIRTAGL